MVFVIFSCFNPNRKSPIKKLNGNAKVKIILELLAPPEKNSGTAKNRYHNKMDFDRCFFTVFPKPESKPYAIEINNKTDNNNDSGK
jgi:hypothetical protein